MDFFFDWNLSPQMLVLHLKIWNKFILTNSSLGLNIVILTEFLDFLREHVFPLFVLLKILAKKMNLFLIICLDWLESLMHLITILLNIADGQP